MQKQRQMLKRRQNATTKANATATTNAGVLRFAQNDNLKTKHSNRDQRSGF
jgi:hypothetical protein